MTHLGKRVHNKQWWWLLVMAGFAAIHQTPSFSHVNIPYVLWHANAPNILCTINDPVQKLWRRLWYLTTGFQFSQEKKPDNFRGIEWCVPVGLLIHGHHAWTILAIWTDGKSWSARLTIAENASVPLLRYTIRNGRELFMPLHHIPLHHAHAKALETGIYLVSFFPFCFSFGEPTLRREGTHHW